jgi:hypothetical protein
MTFKSAHFEPTSNDIPTEELSTPPETILCARDRVATHCSLCSHKRKVLIRAGVDGKRWHYSFCSVCIRALHRRLP